MDLFFVISGFVIPHVYHNRVSTGPEYGTFLQRRVGRLIPLHWMTLILAILIFSLSFVVRHNKINHMPSFDPKCIAATALLLHSFIPCRTGEAFNSVSWSLSAEMVMYVVFPSFAWMGRSSRKNPFLVVALLLSVIMYHLFAAHGVFSPVNWEELPPVVRALPSFLFGVGLFYSREMIARIPLPGVFLLASTTGLIFAMVLAAPGIVVLTGAYATAIFAIAADMRGTPVKLVASLAPLGQLTYSIYMIHALFITVLMNAIGDKSLHGALAHMLGLSFLCYGCIFVASYLSYRFVETPARRKIDGIVIWNKAAT